MGLYRGGQRWLPYTSRVIRVGRVGRGNYAPCYHILKDLTSSPTRLRFLQILTICLYLISRSYITMKVLLTGATGTIGGGALSACLAHPQITKVIAFVRRALPDDISSNPKLETIIIEDFSTWSDDLLDQHMDAAAMIW